MYWNEEYSKKICDKCNEQIHLYRKCPCLLLDRKLVKCRVKRKAFLYTGEIEIEWNDGISRMYDFSYDHIKAAADRDDLTEMEFPHRTDSIEFYWDREIRDNPFNNCIQDINGNYFNLSLARRVEIFPPNWHLYHAKQKSSYEVCYCYDSLLLDNEDFIDFK